MKIAFFSAKDYERKVFEEANSEFGHEIVYLESRLTEETATLAAGFPSVCAFVNDRLSEVTLKIIASGGTRLVALRCAGFNNVDLVTASKLGISIVRVPAYSPHAVAEQALALILALNRKIHRAYHRVREGNFALDGLVGFDLNGKTAGVIGTGRIGQVIVKILDGFGCHVLAYDPYPSDLGGLARNVDLNTIWKESDIITLHCPLTPETRQIVNAAAIAKMKTGVMLINTSRGRLVDTRAIIDGLKSGKVGSLGLDVYEEEEELFFEDLSATAIQDDVFARLLTFPNVIVTGHQAFLTNEALRNIAATTLRNIADFEQERALANEVKPPQ